LVLHFECPINPSFHCNTLYHTSAKKKKNVTTHFNTPINHSSRCNTLQYTAIHCNTLQHTPQHTAPHCITLHHTAKHCTTLLQHRSKLDLYYLHNPALYIADTTSHSQCPINYSSSLLSGLRLFLQFFFFSFFSSFFFLQFFSFSFLS